MNESSVKYPGIKSTSDKGKFNKMNNKFIENELKANLRSCLRLLVSFTV